MIISISFIITGTEEILSLSFCELCIIIYLIYKAKEMEKNIVKNNGMKIMNGIIRNRERVRKC